MRLFLDTCCLSRPWDDQSQVKVHLEAEAVLYLVSEARQGRLELVNSDYLLDEIHDIPEPARRSDVLALTAAAAIQVRSHPAIVARSETFAVNNILDYDALHLAAAEAASCDFFFTTDGRLLRRTARAAGLLKIKVLNPANWPPPSPQP